MVVELMTVAEEIVIRRNAPVEQEACLRERRSILHMCAVTPRFEYRLGFFDTGPGRVTRMTYSKGSSDVPRFPSLFLRFESACRILRIRWPDQRD